METEEMDVNKTFELIDNLRELENAYNLYLEFQGVQWFEDLYNKHKKRIVFNN